MLRIGHKDVVKTELSFKGRKERMDQSEVSVRHGGVMDPWTIVIYASNRGEDQISLEQGFSYAGDVMRDKTVRVVYPNAEIRGQTGKAILSATLTPKAAKRFFDAVEHNIGLERTSKSRSGGKLRRSKSPEDRRKFNAMLRKIRRQRLASQSKSRSHSHSRSRSHSRSSKAHNCYEECAEDTSRQVPFAQMKQPLKSSFMTTFAEQLAQAIDLDDVSLLSALSLASNNRRKQVLDIILTSSVPSILAHVLAIGWMDDLVKRAQAKKHQHPITAYISLNLPEMVLAWTETEWERTDGLVLDFVDVAQCLGQEIMTEDLSPTKIDMWIKVVQSVHSMCMDSYEAKYIQGLSLFHDLAPHAPWNRLFVAVTKLPLVILDPFDSMPSGETIMSLAIEHKNDELILYIVERCRLSLDESANPQFTDWTIVQWLARNGNVDTLQRALEVSKRKFSDVWNVREQASAIAWMMEFRCHAMLTYLFEQGVTLSYLDWVHVLITQRFGMDGLDSLRLMTSLPIEIPVVEILSFLIRTVDDDVTTMEMYLENKPQLAIIQSRHLARRAALLALVDE